MPIEQYVKGEDDVLKGRTKRRITNDMPDNLVFLHVIIYLDRGSLSSNCVGLEYN